MTINKFKKRVAQNPTVMAWFVWLCAVAFYIYQFLLRVAPSVLADDWMASFHINAAALGVMSAGFYYSYVVMQIPVGILMDKLGPRVLISSAALTCAIGCILVAYSESFTGAIVSRILIGAGAACGFLGCIKIATLWFSKSKLGLLAGLTTSLGTIGALLGNLPLAFLTNLYPWRFVMLGLGVFGILIGLVVWLGVRNHKPGESYVDVDESQASIISALKKLARHPHVWIFSLYGFCMYTPIAAFTDLWAVTYFKQGLNISEAQATSLNSFTILGLIASGPLFAGVSETLKSHRWTMFWSSLALLLSFCALCLAPHMHIGFVGLFCFLFGLSFGGEVLCFAGVCSLMPRTMGGISTGFTNMIVMVSGTLFQPAVGYMLQKFGSAEIINGSPIYTAVSFQIAFVPIMATLLGAVLLTFFMKETYPK